MKNKSDVTEPFAPVTGSAPSWEECERKFWQYAAAMEYGIPGDIRKYGREYKAMLAAYEANEAKEQNSV